MYTIKQRCKHKSELQTCINWAIVSTGAPPPTLEAPKVILFWERAKAGQQGWGIGYPVPGVLHPILAQDTSEEPHLTDTFLAPI